MKTKLMIGKDILLDKNEKLITFRNKINGDIFYSTSKYSPVIRDGQEFLPVFQKSAPPKERRINFMALSALEKVPQS